MRETPKTGQIFPEKYLVELWLSKNLGVFLGLVPAVTQVLLPDWLLSYLALCKRSKSAGLKNTVLKSKSAEVI